MLWDHLGVGGIAVLNWVFKKYGRILTVIHLPDHKVQVADIDTSGSVEVHPACYSVDTRSYFRGVKAARELKFILHPLPRPLHDAVFNRRDII
jgi:hypothetical protein